jgi:hypothetical protein
MSASAQAKIRVRSVLYGLDGDLHFAAQGEHQDRHGSELSFIRRSTSSPPV